jgi:trans-AT polyketide synthase, acyltransferase and oxidoreductase domains
MTLETRTTQPLGYWTGSDEPKTDPLEILNAMSRITEPVSILDIGGHLAVGPRGTVTMGSDLIPGAESGSYPLMAYVPPLHPCDLGDPVFKKDHGLRYPYVAGAMANGITSVEMVEVAGKAGMIGFFGSAGLAPQQVEAAIHEIQERLKEKPYGFNLIHSPADPSLESAVVDLYLKYGVTRLSASAYLRLTEPLIHFRIKGIHRDQDGRVVCPNRIVAKVSRVEIARRFFSPPPQKLLNRLVEKGKLTPQEADLAQYVPVADDLTAEADSGGHTDNRPALALLPTMLALRDEMMEKYQYPRSLCVGLGGGIATPESTAAAFAMGAGWVVTGSVNQSCVEAGTSEIVRLMLSEARQADVTMAPAADMFEMGVKVQVLKRGTMFSIRAAKLYECYKAYDNFETIPEKIKTTIERDYFKCSFDEAWDQTKAFFAMRDPSQIQRAEKDSRHKMALVFRSYLGRSSNWAVSGDPERKIDYQIWCGPAIGAFNEWIKGTFLQHPVERKTVTVAMNLLLGACVVTRANWLKTSGLALPAGISKFSPLTLPKIEDLLGCKVN